VLNVPEGSTCGVITVVVLACGFIFSVIAFNKSGSASGNRIVTAISFNFQTRDSCFIETSGWSGGGRATVVTGPRGALIGVNIEHYERSLAAKLLNQVVRPRQHRWLNGERSDTVTHSNESKGP